MRIHGKAALTAIFLSCIGCYEYEEGPWFTIVSPTYRMKGEYVIDEVWVDGESHLQQMDTLNIISYNFTDKEHPNNGMEYNVTYGDSPSIRTSHWYFIPFEEEVRITVLDCYVGLPQPVPFAPLPGYVTTGNCYDYLPPWRIVKLTDKRIWLEMEFNEALIEVRLIEK